MPWTWWVSIVAALMLGLNLGVVFMGMRLADGQDRERHPSSESQTRPVSAKRI